MMRVPIQAIWPPLAIFCVDFAAFAVSLANGWWPIAAIMAVACVIMLLDARARVRDYHYAQSLFSMSRNPERIAGIFQTSWCGRVACEVAAGEVNSSAGEAVRAYHRNTGYRWYHIFPDGTFARKSTFFEPFFWRVTLLGHERARGREPVKSRRPARAAQAVEEASSPAVLHRAA